MKKLFLILSITPSLALHGSSRDLKKTSGSSANLKESAADFEARSQKSRLRTDLDGVIQRLKDLETHQEALILSLKSSNEHWHTELKKINSKTNDAFQAVEARFAALDRQELLASPAESATATPPLNQDH